MRRFLPILLVLAACAVPVQAHGLLIPKEKSVPPLAMVNHLVDIKIDDQVAVTRVEQTFRNHTDQQLEATYIFPVPKGASVRKFSMWVDGKEVPGEMVEAAKARQIYENIVRRTLDPGLLEYMGNDLLRLKVFPIPPRGDQKLAVSYTSVVPAENGLIEYVYPLKTDGKATATLEKFGVKVTLNSQHAVQNIYSPTHAITVTRPSDRQAVINFEKDQGLLDRDFLLYYTAGGKDVGLTALTHRPSDGKDGYFMMLVSPRAELSKEQQIPRDMIFVLDTSGSMRGKRIIQARNALKFCLNNLQAHDRFAIMNFATTVNKYTENLLSANKSELERARKWVDDLEATGGTAIDEALAAAMAMRTSDDSRPFTIVFFTDGQPTIGETDTAKILKNVTAKNTAGTRIFTFGVGDDLNASFLDQLAEQTRAISTYVREAEDIETKTASLYGKISNPVLTNLKLTVGDNIKVSEVYPPQLPDLFHGTQLVVLGRYTGRGPVAIKLNGKVGKDAKEFVYETTFAAKTGEDKGFVEDLWARRKVGYMLDQIRVNGEKKELVDEVVTLAKRYGITTPYTSYLIVPDNAVPVARGGQGGFGGRPDVRFLPGGGPAPVPPGLVNADKADSPIKVADFAKDLKGDLEKGRGKIEDDRLNRPVPVITAPARGPDGKELPPSNPTEAAEDAFRSEAKATKKTLEKARLSLLNRNLDEVQTGQVGVDLSVQTNNLRNQSRLSQTAVRRINDSNCLEVGGVWIDESFSPKMKTLTIKTMSKAYFRLLERQPSVRDVLRLGNHLVWVTPSGTALVIDTSDGREEMSDADIDRLFVPSKK